MPSLSRRTFLVALLPTALSVGEAAAQVPAAPLTFSAVVVDVTHLREIGLGPFADIVQAAMTDELRQVFADRMSRNGPRLVVVVTGLFLASLPEGGAGYFREGSSRTSGFHRRRGSRGGRPGRDPRAFSPAQQPDRHGGLVAGSALRAERAAAVARNYAEWLRRYTIP